MEGVARLHALIAEHADTAGEVTVGIETDRGLLVGALVAVGYDVVAVNPRAVDRYRDRHTVSGGKSDGGDAKVLADLVRTDGHNHRRVAGDSDLAEAVKVLARSHQSLIWTRQRQLNQLRSALRDFYPAALVAFGTDLAHPDAVAILTAAPTPERGRRLSTSKIASALRRAGRRRNLDTRAVAIRDALRADQLAAPALVADAYGATTTALVGVIAALTRQIVDLQSSLADHFEQHPDADILRSLPGLGVILGARVLAELRRRPEPLPACQGPQELRRDVADRPPVRPPQNRPRPPRPQPTPLRALDWWAFCSLQTSPGARALYDTHRTAGDLHHQALRAVANRWVGILHGCLRHRHTYDETTAWPDLTATPQQSDHQNAA